MAFQKSLFQYLFDSSSLINIERSKKMTVLRKRRGEVLIPEKVAAEVNQPNTPLHRFISKFYQVVIQFQNNEEQEYLRVRSQIGIDDGEAAAIAMAIKRQLPLVIDDKKGREKAENHGVRILSWQDFIGT
jgi:predicted nucleic acid-binding protein